MHVMHVQKTTIFAAFCFSCSFAALAEDWPTYRHDPQRSGVTSVELTYPLREGWRFQPQHAPQRAWPRPFRENAWSDAGKPIRTLLTFDHAFHTVVAGNRAYFGSSADHKVYCLDATTGEVLWEFFTEGPVRMAPSIWKGKVYVGSDDGRVYCLNATTGALLWQEHVGPSDARLPGNEQIISRWPVRSGVVVTDGVAYAAGGLFPRREGSHLSAVDAESGKKLWTQKIDQVSQGYLLTSKTRLYVPSGKLSPFIYDKENGAFVTKAPNPRGTFALISGDVLFSGPGVLGGKIGAAKATGKDRLATFPGNQMVVTDGVAYLLSDTTLAAANPKGSEQKSPGNAATWQRDSKYPHALILAGRTLIAGGDNEVAAFRTTDGEPVWKAKVNGRAYGLAVTAGRLFVSTDQGTIHCFASIFDGEKRIVNGIPSKGEPFSTADLDVRAAATLERVTAENPYQKGYCLVFGSGDGRLAYEIARRTQLNVIVTEEDAAKITVARQNLDRAGLYGRRVVIHQSSPDKLPYSKYLFNLIVSERTLPPHLSVRRLLRPFGVACVGALDLEETELTSWLESVDLETSKVVQGRAGHWAVIHRAALSGSGEWSHQYAGPGNTTCSEDELITSDLELLWFGRPGPYRMFDRHSFTAAPVSTHGRLFTLGERILYGQDAYNGTLLWTTELPDLKPRVNIPRDSGFMAANDQRVFLATGDKCRRIDAATGQEAPPALLPEPKTKYGYDWGYVATVDDLLFGSGVRKGTFFNEGRGPWYDDSGLRGARHSRKVLSDYVFATGWEDGTTRWRYDGVIMNSTITLGGGRMYFVENRHPKVLASESRRLGGSKEWFDLFIVGLDQKTGEKRWEQEVHYDKRTVVFYLSYKDEILIALRSTTAFDISAFDATNGYEIWSKQHDWLRNHHGSHRRHPVIIGDAIFQQPQAYDLRTGAPTWRLEENGACGTLSASSSVVFCRVNYPRMYDLKNKGAADNLVEVTRPGCWINIITAGGVVLMPEAGSGCSCEFPIHATMAFVPR